MNTETLKGTQEAAEFLGLSPYTLTQWRSTGARQIPFIRIGRAVRYRLDDLRAFVEQNRVVA